MALITFKDLPDTSTPLNAANINNNFKEVFNLVYPVGSIYMSVNSTNPNTLFGVGTWERIKDKFLLSAGDTYSAGATGGEATHTLTESEMPSHTHNGTKWAGTTLLSLNGGSNNGLNLSYSSGLAENKSYIYTEAAGGSQPHNNMPPYLAVYIWKRTA